MLARIEKSVGRYSQIRHFPKPQKKNLESVRNWVEGKRPVIEEESHFLDDAADLAALASSSAAASPLENWAEAVLWSKFLKKVVQLPDITTPEIYLTR